MAKKQDQYYFDTFVACVNYAVQAAQMLKATLTDFHPDNLESQLEQIHKIEHAADCRKHDMMEILAKAFITPIEREDIVTLSHNIDSLVDKIEDVVIRLYCNNIQSIRPDSLPVAELIVQSCEAVEALMKEFSDFKHSKAIRERLIHISNLEEEGDKLYIAALRQLHVGCTDSKEVFVWHELYRYLEHCLDACERVADTVESVIMKNS